MHFTAKIGRTLTAAVLIAAVAGTARSAAAQTPTAAPSWQALVGCWEPVATARDAAPDSARGHLVCIVPVAGSTSAVDMFTIANATVVAQERVDASGIRQPLTRDDCSGWQTAEWSATGQRLYLRSELTCEGGLKRTSSGVISMPTSSEWLDVQSVGVGERKAVRALRYREARSYAAIPAELSQVIGARPFSVGVNTARMLAASPVSHADLIDVSRHLDVAATEVWLVEQELAFTADAKALMRLADAGIPGSVIDVVVAMSYPEAFSLATPKVAQGGGQMRGVDDPYGNVGLTGYDPYWDPYYGSRYNYNRRYYSPYGFSQYGSAYGYGSGWYPSQRPVIIVVGPAPDPNAEPAPARADGKVVKGSGYTRRPTSSATADRERSAAGSSAGSSSSGSSSSGSSSTGSSSTGSSGSSGSTGSSSSGERTAKRRPPPSGSN